jgi:hypothetical protein
MRAPSDLCSACSGVVLSGSLADWVKARPRS